MKKLDLNKEESLLVETQEPSRKKGLSSRAAFIQEKNFHKNAYNSLTRTTQQFVNYSYDNMHYGKIDNNSYSITPKKEFLKQIKTREGSLFAFNFVVDAFQDFIDFWSFLQRRQSLKEDSEIYELKPLSAFVDLDMSYSKMYEVYKNKFFTFIDQNKYTNQILDFKTFLHAFISFVDTQVPLLPITKGFYNTSKFFDIKGNGLTIQFADTNKADDNKRYNLWIKDENFEIYKNSLEQYGFMIDKSNPWIISANINSIPMKKYLKKYQTESDQFFEKFYNKVHLSELTDLQQILLKMYNEFVAPRKSFVKVESKICKNDEVKVKTEQLFRQELKNLDGQLSTEKWIRFYLFLRAREVNLNLTQAEFNIMVKTAADLEKGLDLSAAMRYVEPLLNKAISDKIKNKNYQF